MQYRRVVLLPLLLAGLIFPLCRVQPAGAHTTVYVSSAGRFQDAVARLRQSGGTIVLTANTYSRELVIGPRSANVLEIVGTRKARVRSILLDRTQYVHIDNVGLHAMSAGDGGIHSEYSSHITLTRLRVSAIRTTHIEQLNLDHSNHVRVEDSRFAHCGDNAPEWSMCLLTRYADNVTITRNVFHDCRGCDFIHGRAGANLRITRNRFERALACHHSWEKCRHQDLIELFAANGLLVSRNIFGVSQFGGAQLYLATAVDHVLIENNLFRRSDSKAPGVEPHVGILVGTKAAVRVPHDVTIVNNTIRSGFARPDHDAQSIVLSPHYDYSSPVVRGPVIANNILARQLEPRLVCPRVSRSLHNVVSLGTACRPTDVTGDPQLLPSGRPSAESLLVIDKADPILAPRRDLVDHRRVGPPDIGAYEYVR